MKTKPIAEVRQILGSIPMPDTQDGIAIIEQLNRDLEAELQRQLAPPVTRRRSPRAARRTR